MDKQTIVRKKKARNTANPPQIRDVFTVICRTDLKVECVKEYKFHPTRRWRFDYAIPEHKIALEVEGGVWTGGRHTSPKGFLGDIEKYNTATLMGWRVFRTTPDELYKLSTINLIKAAILWLNNPEKAPFLP
ncbi:MAG: DNA mismatch endonuclease [Bacteriophage sp.]|nr:MAG: DNA mismatch endonuclease [Bacteriophage sp.]